MNKASLIFANSKPLAHMLRRERTDTVTVPLGVATELFSHQVTKTPSERKRKLTIGFIGGISDRIDFPLLSEVVQRLKDVQFEFIGPSEPNVFGKPDTALELMKALATHRNVRWIPGIPKKDVPKVVARFDIGLVPYRENMSFNTYSFPMKVMEYFLAGKPVISADIVALREYAKKRILYIASSPESVIRAINHLRRRGWLEQKQQLQHSIAMAMSWQRKVDKIIHVVSDYMEQ